MKTKQTPLLCVAILFFLFNGGFQSTGGKEEPRINFYGTITAQGSKDSAENILISGLYEQIKFYAIPKSTTAQPTHNVTFIRLDDIKKITQPTPLPGETSSIKTFDGRDYIEVSLTFEGNKTENYLVERSRKIYYDVPFKNETIEPLHKEIAIEALTELKINGYKQKNRQSIKKKSPNSPSAAKQALCKQAQTNISDLEKTVQDVESPLRSMIENIKQAVNHLCG